jgi:nucleoside 2-deoxyribosyltransferase
MKVYVGAPFFNERQLQVVLSIEAVLDQLRIAHYSPRIDGVLIEMPPAERLAQSRRIFNLNKTGIRGADIVIAVVDDRDPGVMWEIGFAHAQLRPPKIVTYSDVGHGLNIMVRCSVDVHVCGLDELRACLSTVGYDREGRVVINYVSNFDPRKDY